MTQENSQTKNTNRLTFRAGDVIVNEVGQSHFMYAVESGEVHIEYDWDVIDVVSEGQPIGDIFQTATLVAVSDCILAPFEHI